MKQYIYMTIGFCCFAFAFSGCSEKDEISDSDSGTKIEGIALSLDASGTEAGAEAETRANVSGVTYVVNTTADPTYKSSSTGSIGARGTAGWKLELKLYNGKNTSGAVEDTPYTDGSFIGGSYDTNKKYWIPTSDKFFPNYFTPQAEAWLYPDTKDAAIETNQDDVAVFVKQDILYKTKGVITIAHTPTVILSHQRAMLDFIVSDVIKADIAEVTVLVGSTPTVYKPFLVKETTLMNGSMPTGAVDLEYMLILPVGITNNSIIVQIKTNLNSTIEQPITYKQTVNTGSALATNTCYCFKLQGNSLTISPVTIMDWTTGEPVSGEYIGVTEYPTFKGVANATWYLYFDNKLKKTDGTPKLQAITFNDEGECTIKPDGRVITHIFRSEPTNVELSTDPLPNKLSTPIPLDKMYITLP